MSPNDEMTLVDKLQTVLKALAARREEIEAVLPPDLSFDRFHATVNQALRNNPDVFKATIVSIINACVKAAYDGCRLDGREAALVLHSVKVQKNPDRWEDQAQYFPMVFGVIQQILRGGEVVAIDVDVIHENDQYQVSRGTNAEIAHYPELVKPRGAMIAAYSVATLKSGHKVTCLMTKLEIEDVMKEAKTQFVWKRWPGEMAKKSVIRRHRKLLPLGDRDIVDVEANEMFPQFANQQAPAQGAIPARPTRSGAAGQAMLGDASSEGLGVQIDFGNNAVQAEGELIEASPSEAKSSTKSSKIQPRDDAVDLPADETEWSAWAKDVERWIIQANKPADVIAIAEQERGRIDAASDQRRDFIKSLISDRLADFASEAAADQANGSDDNQTAE
jgi:recombination protein RecT